MNRIVGLVSLLSLFAGIGCRHKENAPSAPGSAPTPLQSAGLVPSVERAPATPGEFEGEIGLVTKGKLAGSVGAPVELTLRVKGNKLRVDLPDSLTAARGLGPVYLLVQPDDKRAYAILDAKKQAVLLELDKLSDQAKALGARVQPGNGTASPSSAWRLERTGKFDTVAGIRCEVSNLVEAKIIGEACIAEQDTPWFHVPSAAVPAEFSWLTAMADGQHLPLRYVLTNGGAETGRVEVTRIVANPLPASSFEPPANYAVMNFDQVIAAMMGGFGGPGRSGVKLPPGMKLPAGVKVPAPGNQPKNK